VNLHWTARAESRLKRIQEHIAEDNPSAAFRMIEHILKRSLTIPATPRIGRRVPEYDCDDIREVFEHPYRIIYRINPRKIDVIAVMHLRQLLPDLLNRLR
jgi:plasmid stabilization system protein ParE